MGHRRTAMSRRDKQHVDRRVENNASWDVNERAVDEQCRIQRCERLPLDAGNTRQVRFELSRIRCQRRCQALDAHAARQGLTSRQLRRISAVNEHELGAREVGLPDRRQVQVGECGPPIERRRKRGFRDRGDVREAPVLVSGRRKPERLEAVARMLARTLQPFGAVDSPGCVSTLELRQISVQRFSDLGHYALCLSTLDDRLLAYRLPTAGAVSSQP